MAELTNSEVKAIVSLEKYFDAKIQYLEKLSSQTATNLERRLEGMNEFRDQLKDQAASFVTRDELNLIKEKLDADIRVLREFKAVIDNKAPISLAYIAILLAILSIIVNIILKFS